MTKFPLASCKKLASLILLFLLVVEASKGFDVGTVVGVAVVLLVWVVVLSWGFTGTKIVPLGSLYSCWWRLYWEPIPPSLPFSSFFFFSSLAFFTLFFSSFLSFFHKLGWTPKPSEQAFSKALLSLLLSFWELLLLLPSPLLWFAERNLVEVSCCPRNFCSAIRRKEIWMSSQDSLVFSEWVF